MKIKSKVFSSISAILCGLLVFSACEQGPQYTWNLADLGNEVNFHSQAQAAFLADEDYNNILTYANAGGKEELSLPEPVTLSWSATPANDAAGNVSSYVVEISATGSFNDGITYTTTECELEVYNLCIGTDYSWRVTAQLEDGKTSVSKTSTFTTADVAPRNMYVDGITNVRDLGGWKTEDGGRVKQGMIYRSGRLNLSETTTYTVEITEQGIKTMRDEMGVRTQIDLRSPTAHNNEAGGITSSPLGDDVTYYNCAMEWNTSNILTYSGNRESILRVFSILADENNYPLVYHCNIGTDRTGLFAILVNGLLGVSEEDLYRDYLFSNFGRINGTRTLSNNKAYMDTIKSYDGATLSEKIENCLLDLGVMQSEIDAIRWLLSE